MLRKRATNRLLHLLAAAFIVISIGLAFGPVPAAGQTETEPQSSKTPADYVQSGREFIAEGQNEKAIEAFRKAIELDPKAEEIYLELAALFGSFQRANEQIELLHAAHRQIPSSKIITTSLFLALMRSGREQDVIDTGREYLAQEPTNAPAMVAMASIYTKRKQFTEAAELWERAIEVDPGNAGAWYGLAGVYGFMNRTQEAVDALQRVLDSVPKGELHNMAWAARVASLAKLGFSRESYEQVDLEIRENPDNDLAFLMRAILKQERQLPEEAIADAERAAAISSNSLFRSIALSVLGGNQILMSRYRDAIEPLKESLELFPENAPSHALLATAFFYSAEYEEAIDQLDKAIHSKLLDWPILNSAKFTMEAFNNLAICLIKIGRPEDAEKALRYSAQLDPTQAGPRTNLATLLIMQKRYSEAESELRACIQQGIADWRTYMALGSLLTEQKQYAESIPVYRQALKLQPENPMILNNLGYALAETNTNPEEAVDLLKRAVKRMPSVSAIRDSLGWAYFKAGDLSKAEEELLQAIKLDSKSSVLPDHLGDVYGKMGRKADSVAQWRSALALATTEADKIRIQSKIDEASAKAKAGIP